MNIYSYTSLFLLFFIAIACSNSSDSHFTITGEIKGLPEESQIQLIPVSLDKEEPFIDTIAINGKFKIKGKIDEPRAMLLKIEDGFGTKHLILENKSIEIKGEITSSEVNGTKMYDFSGITISGSPLTTYYEEQLSVKAELDKQHKAYSEKYAHVTKNLAKFRNENNQQAIDSMKTSEDYLALLKEETDFFSKIGDSFKGVVMKNKDSYWGPLMMITLLNYINNEFEPWYEAFSPEAKESYYGKKVHEALYPIGNKGAKIAEFTVQNDNKEDISFADLRKGKKYILLDFWASWCQPCLKEIPHLKKLYQQYADDGLQIVSISIDQKEEDWKKKIDEVNFPWPSYLDRNGISSLYKIKAVPTMHLVDEEGIIIEENIMANELDSILVNLFGSDFPENNPI